MIALGGMSGSGKSTLGHALSHIIDSAVFLDSDVLHKKMYRVSPLTPLPQEAYAASHIHQFIEYARREAARQMRAYDIVIITGTFIDEKTPAEQAKFARDNGADFIGLYLHAPLSTLFARVSERHKTPSDADLSVLKRQAKHILGRSRKDFGWIFINSDQSMDKVVNDALKAIDKAHRRMKNPKPMIKKISSPKNSLSL